MTFSEKRLLISSIAVGCTSILFSSYSWTVLAFGFSWTVLAAGFSWAVFSEFTVDSDTMQRDKSIKSIALYWYFLYIHQWSD